MSTPVPFDRCRRGARVAAWIAATAVISLTLVGAPTPATSEAGAAPPPYRHPTSRAVSRPFDVSAGPYGAGNRGLEYAVAAGDPISAIGAGVVVFAGTVAGGRFVTILHEDGLRSSYSYLASIAVSRGAPVAMGQVIATSSARFQLGVRRGDTYLDPAPLLARRGPPRRARLIPFRRD